MLYNVYSVYVCSKLQHIFEPLKHRAGTKTWIVDQDSTGLVVSKALESSSGLVPHVFKDVSMFQGFGLVLLDLAGSRDVEHIS